MIYCQSNDWHPTYYNSLAVCTELFMNFPRLYQWKWWSYSWTKKQKQNKKIDGINKRAIVLLFGQTTGFSYFLTKCLSIF